MPTTLAPDDTQTLVSLAAGRFADNCAALGMTLTFPELDFAIARDGSLSAKRGGQWLAGCSVPRRAADVMLRNEHWKGRSLCLLTPTNGHQAAACLHRLGPTKALVVVVPSIDCLAEVLACCDFTAAIVAGRLHFAWDEASLRRVFADHPGLAVPQQMVRLPDVDPDAVAAAQAWTQNVLSPITGDHAVRMRSAARAEATTGRCILVGRHFRLWNDAGDTLARVCGAGDVVLNADDPLHSAEAVLAERTAAAGSVLSDRARPTWATWDRPWITWLTRPTIPPYQPAFARDALLLADECWLPLARAAGWPVDRLTVARWPAEAITVTPGRPLALIADHPDLDPPADVRDLSGRLLVWEAIREELTRDPFALGDDPARYVERAPSRLNLPPAVDFPTGRFVDALVGPAFTVGIAGWLAAKGVPFTLHGRGWSGETTLSTYDRGPIADREAFHQIVASSGGVIDPFVTTAGHPVRSLAVPVLRAFGRTPQRVLQDVAAIQAGRLPVSPVLSPLCQAAVLVG
ncbi:MAG TPA: hypothetical protein VF595_09900 [Tepidisphaeraceae bacterium]